MEGDDDERELEVPAEADDLDAFDDAEPADDPESADDLQPAGDLEPADNPEPAVAEDPADGLALAEPVVVEPWQPPARRHKWLMRLLVPLAVGIPAAVAGNVVLQASGLKDSVDVDPRLAGALRYDSKGDPLVKTPDAKIGTVRARAWRVCGKTCDKVSGRGAEFRPGEVLAGSRVQVQLRGSSGEATIETPGWDGRLQALRRPTLSGQPRIGATVRAARGKWTGGWLGGQTLIGIRACPTSTPGGRCVALTSSILAPDSGQPERVIPAAFRGWWIGAIEWHVPPGRAFAESEGTGDPATPKQGVRSPTQGATVAVGPLRGPIR